MLSCLKPRPSYQFRTFPGESLEVYRSDFDLLLFAFSALVRVIWLAAGICIGDGVVAVGCS